MAKLFEKEELSACKLLYYLDIIFKQVVEGALHQSNLKFPHEVILTYIIFFTNIGSALQQDIDFINVTSKTSLKQWSGASDLYGDGDIVC